MQLRDLPPHRQQAHAIRCELLYKQAFDQRMGELAKQSRDYSLGERAYNTAWELPVGMGLGTLAGVGTGLAGLHAAGISDKTLSPAIIAGSGLLGGLGGGYLGLQHHDQKTLSRMGELGVNPQSEDEVLNFLYGDPSALPPKQAELPPGARYVSEDDLAKYSQLAPDQLSLLAQQIAEAQRDTPRGFEPGSAAAGALLGAPMGLPALLAMQQYAPEAPTWAHALVAGAPATLGGLAGGFGPGMMAGGQPQPEPQQQQPQQDSSAPEPPVKKKIQAKDQSFDKGRKRRDEQRNAEKKAAFIAGYIKRAQELNAQMAAAGVAQPLPGNDYIDGPVAGSVGTGTYPPLFKSPEVTTDPHPLDQSAGEAEVEKKVQKIQQGGDDYKTLLARSQA